MQEKKTLEQIQNENMDWDIWLYAILETVQTAKTTGTIYLNFKAVKGEIETASLSILKTKDGE